jgi:hypothetical protein
VATLKKFLILALEYIIVIIELKQNRILRFVIICGAILILSIIYIIVRILILSNKRLSEYKDLLHPQMTAIEEQRKIQEYIELIFASIFVYFMLVILYFFIYSLFLYLLYSLHGIIFYGF